MERKIVYRVEEDMDPKELYCTTYQMRSFYRQFGSGFFSSLDVMNYIQHHKAVLMMRKGNRVLDLACGRSLLLPLIRWNRPNIKEYVGVDISEKNVKEAYRVSAIRRIEDIGVDKYYPFKVTHYISAMEDVEPKKLGKFDFVVFTSSIEHMQKDVGIKALKLCKEVMTNNSTLFLSCPNTFEKKDPYDTQYRAHIYEWDLEELKQTLINLDFEIKDVFGLVAKKREFDKFMESKEDPIKKIYNRFKQYLPTEWLMSLFPILYPEIASEVLLLVQKKK